MRIETESYQIQAPRWPKSGRHILAQYDAETIVVYQAYRPSIGNFAAEHGYFGGEFSYSRMSWIKPNFLWMMYRSGWGTKEGQEVTLAVRIRRSAFDAILKDAVYSTYVADVYGDPIAWKKAVAGSDVRLQWDPDHSPAGGKLERRAIQLGLRGRTLAHFGREWIVDIEDVSEFVEAQRLLLVGGSKGALVTPLEDVYPVADENVALRLGVDVMPNSSS